MNKKLKWIIIGAVVLIIGFIIICGSLFLGLAFAGNEIQKEEAAENQKIETDKKKLTAYDIEERGDEIIGKIENTLDYKIDYLEVNFKFYDENNVIINEDMTNKTEFKPGEVWQFKIYLIDNKYEKYDYSIDLSVY